MDTNLNSQSTPLWAVQYMCNLCEPAISDPHIKVFEPGCGTGNFLVEIMSRRLNRCKNDPQLILIALSNIYAVDISAEALERARYRLRECIENYLAKETYFLDYRFWPQIDVFLNTNLILADLLNNHDEIIFVEWQKQEDFHFVYTTCRMSDIASTKTQCPESCKI